jgi:four helix bundle protein
MQTAIMSLTFTREHSIFQRRSLKSQKHSLRKNLTYSLKDQLRRSSRSIGAQIAEAWAKRRYEKHFISKLTDADAEQMGSQHWMQVAHSCGYISEEILQEWQKELNTIGRMLHTMMKKSNAFCSIKYPRT